MNNLRTESEIVSSWKGNPSFTMVSILCLTYNHEKYIESALKGFLMQLTDFPIEVLIHEDASSDKTAKIIRKYEYLYPTIIKPIYQAENQWSKNKEIIRKLEYDRIRGKYVAYCEGDDYWIDSKKLQKQVDFLENNQEYGLVHSELDHYYVTSNRWVRNHWRKSGVNNQSGDIYQSLLLGKDSMIYACTTCIKAEFIKDNEEYDKIAQQNFMMGDVPLWLYISSKSKIGYLPESTAVRNVLPFSVTQGRSFNYNLDFLESGWRVFEYFDGLNPIAPTQRKLAVNQYYLSKIDLCFNYKTNLSLFDKCNSLLNKEFKSKILILKRIGIKYKHSHIIIRLIIKIYNIIH